MSVVVVAWLAGGACAGSSQAAPDPYSGRTSQGKPITFAHLVDSKSLESVSVVLRGSCKGTPSSLVFTIPSLPLAPDGSFSFTGKGARLAGSLQLGGTATGTLRASWRKSRTTCDSGSVRWSASRVNPPRIEPMGDVTAEASSLEGVAVSYPTPVVLGAVSVSFSPSNGSLLKMGTTTVTLTAQDARGRTASAAFKVLVVPSRALYQSLLGEVESRLRAGIERIGAARAVESLSREVSAARDAFDAARRKIEALPAPAGASAQHQALVSALGEYAGALNAVANAAGIRQLCGAPSVLARLSQHAGTEQLRRAAADLVGVGFRLSPSLPDRREDPSRRLVNGQILAGASRSGDNTLTVKNGLSSDGVVSLVDSSKRPVVSAYVQASSELTLGSIPSGAYEIFFTTGIDWDDELRTFTRDCRFTKFRDAASFESTATTYTAVTITLNPVPGGSAPTSSVSPGDFPPIS